MFSVAVLKEKTFDLEYSMTKEKKLHLRGSAHAAQHPGHDVFYNLRPYIYKR